MTKDRRENRRTRTIPEAAEALGIATATAYIAAKSGELPTIKIGKRLLVPTAALDKMLKGGAA
jgi:excisionase family DNA binding protein